MAITVSNSNTQLTSADAATGFTSEGGGGAGPGVEPDFFYQGTGSISRKMGASAGGFKYVHGSTTDMTVAADSLVLLKANWTNYRAIDPRPSSQLWIGSAVGNHIEYDIADDGTRGDIDYPNRGGWILALINPNVVAWRDEVVGTPTLTAIDTFVIQSDFSATSKGENVMLDAIDINPGLYLVGNTPDGVWADFLAHDEGTIGNSFGHIFSNGTIISLQGLFTIGETSAGTDTATTFTDTDKVLVFVPCRVDEGETGIEVELANASTAVTFTRHAIIGEGRDNQKHFFDTDNEVSAAADEITFTNGHNFQTGDAVNYSKEGGTETPAGAEGTDYFVERVSATVISLHTTRLLAFAAGAPDVALTESTAGNGESHSLQRLPDTRPIILSRGTSGTFVIEDSALSRIGLITMTTGFTITDTQLSGSRGILMSSGQGIITNLTVNSPLVPPGEAFISTTDTDNITGCTFNIEADGGHAIEITSTAASPMSLTDNTIVGQGARIDPVLPGALDDGNDEIDFTAHGFATGEEVYYNDGGFTSITGLTDGAKYYVRAVTANAISFHATEFDAENNLNKIAISGGGAGAHQFASGHTAIFNNSGGAITINVSGGTAPTVRNSVGSSTTVNANVTATFVGMKDNSEVRVYATGTFTELDGIENATAGSPDNRSFAASVAAATVVDYIIFSTLYVPIHVIGFTWPSSAGSTIPVSQILDRNYSNP